MIESEAVEILKGKFPEWAYEGIYRDEDKYEYEMAQLAIKALEKQIPKKPIKSEKQVVRYVNTYYCPICNLGITGTNIAKWCYHCGQKLDWSNDNEK